MANKAIAQEWKDSDGYWILLRDGFHIEGAHAIHEGTKAKAHKRLREVRPCKCLDCRAISRAK